MKKSPFLIFSFWNFPSFHFQFSTFPFTIFLLFSMSPFSIFLASFPNGSAEIFPVRSLWWAFYRRPRLLRHCHQPTFVSQTSSFLISKSKSYKLFAQLYVHRSSGEGCICGWVFMGLDPALNYPHFNTPCPLQIVQTNNIYNSST